jgi:hypothetical protein
LAAGFLLFMFLLRMRDDFLFLDQDRLDGLIEDDFKSILR